MKIILEGVVGSTAHGLATENSDIDKLGVFVAPTAELLGLDVIGSVKKTHASNNPDITLHEAHKFCTLALKCNPTILELLWLHDYTIMTPGGGLLVKNRQSFLSDSYVRNAYIGYVHGQLKKFQKDKTLTRASKHGRHCARLLIQGLSLLESGDIPIDVTKDRDWILHMQNIAVSDPEHYVHVMEYWLAKLNRAKSYLPSSPDIDKINDTLITIRLTENPSDFE